MHASFQNHCISGQVESEKKKKRHQGQACCRDRESVSLVFYFSLEDTTFILLSFFTLLSAVSFRTKLAKHLVTVSLWDQSSYVFFNLSQTGSPVSVVIDWFIVPESAQIMCSLTISFIIYTLLCQAPNGSAENKQWSLCVFDDVIEHTGSVSIKLLNII